MSELNKLENLEELFFKCNPLTKEVPQSDVRGKLIAKLRKLKKFNNSMVGQILELKGRGKIMKNEVCYGSIMMWYWTGFYRYLHLIGLTVKFNKEFVQW